MKQKLKIENTTDIINDELDSIPADWEFKPISMLVEKTKQMDMKKTDAEFKYIDVSGVDRTSLRIIDYKKFRGKEAPSRARKIVKKNDVIVATVRPTLKRIALIDDNFDNEICSTAFCVLRVNPNKLDYRYLYYSIQRKEFIDSLGKIQRGASYPAITDSDIKNQKIFAPPLSEQKKIAFVLSTIQEEKEKTENIINSMKELKKSVMKHLFTYGPVSLEEAENVKLKETEIGMVPDGWHLLAIGDVLADGLKNGIYKPKEYFGKGDAQIIQLNDLYNSKRVLDLKAIESIQITQNELDSYLLKNEDCIVNRVSKRQEGIAKVSVVKDLESTSKIIFESNMFRLRLDQQKIDSDFFSYFSEDYRYKSQALKKSNKGNQTSINQGALKSIVIPSTSKSTQRKIVTILRTIDEKIQNEDNKKRALEELFKSMLHNLMTAKTRVKDLEIVNV